VILVVAFTLGLGVGSLFVPHQASPQPSTGGGQYSLLWAQSQNVNTVAQAVFTVPGGHAISVLIIGTVNVSCGGPSYAAGTPYYCDLSLVNGSTGGPTEDLLWDLSFTGHVVTVTSDLAPGSYTLLIRVVIGAAPAAVLLTNFDTTLSVTGTN
jgi:hypothetical protein